ncbi:hypothetical protein F53441_14136 [Fusarium austroafricanum]|uniref:Uncharacterized protein n=1 Tax=Fusarium austroafricanum TaxID=2364996 RepID=A0A8H4JH55_9HYPO|nr:hypothetical protein F53441_14136 [Fusarium austroafricanum]
MEYVAIPWDNHNKESKNDLEKWTVNLALWFMHILAGNSFEVSWSYVDLTDEVLVLSQPNVESEQSPLSSKALKDAENARDEEDNEPETSEESDSTNLRTSPRAKRKRNRDEEENERDGFHHSFSKRQNI